MPTFTTYEQLSVNTIHLKPVPRPEVEAYLAEFNAVASPIRENGDVDQMNWQAWRALRAPDYFIQWNTHQGRFRLTVDEYLERWQWSVRTGRIWDALDHKTYITDTGFIVEGLLKSRHTDRTGEHVILPLCETFHIQNGLAVFSCEYVDPTYLAELDAEIPGGW